MKWNINKFVTCLSLDPVCQPAQPTSSPGAWTPSPLTDATKTPVNRFFCAFLNKFSRVQNINPSLRFRPGPGPDILFV